MRRKTFAILFLFLCGALFGQTEAEQLWNSPEELFTYARGLYDRAFYEMALQEFERFTFRFPEHTATESSQLYQLNCLQKLGRQRPMLQMLHSFLEQHPQTTQRTALLTLSAETLFNLGDYAQAIQEYQTLKKEKISPQDQEKADYFIAQSHAKLKQLPEAMEILKRLADLPFDKKFPYRPNATHEFAYNLYNEGHLAEAFAYYQKIATAPDFCHPLLVESALFTTASIFMQTAKPKEALERFNAYLTEYPTGQYASQARRNRIRLEAQMGHWKEALVLLNAWRQTNPDARDYEMDYIQATALLQSRLFAEAVPYFQRCEEDPAVPATTRQEAAYANIYCLLSSNQFLAAEQNADRFLEKYPRSAHRGSAALWRGQALKQLDRPEEAEEAFRLASTAFEDSPQELLTAQTTLAAFLQDREKFQEAAELYRSIAKNPKFHNARKYLLSAGQCEEKRKNPEQAEKDYLAAAEAPECAELAYRLLSHLCIQQKRWEDALANLEKLIPLVEDKNMLTDLKLNAAKIHSELNQFPQAEQLLREIIAAPETTETQRLSANKSLLENLFQAEKPTDEAYRLLQSFLPNPAPLSDELLHHVATLAQKHGKNAIAIAAREVLHKRTQSPLHNISDLNLAELYLLAKKTDEALSILSQFKPDTPGLPPAELPSLLAEAFYNKKEFERAAFEAEQAISIPQASPKNKARALIILTKIRLFVEKKPKLANNFATQCYILYEDSLYSPLAMFLSAECFRQQRMDAEAEQVMHELREKYPTWTIQSSD